MNEEKGKDYKSFELIEMYFEKLSANHYSSPNELFKTLYYYYLSPKDLLMIKRFNRKALNMLIENIILSYKSSKVYTLT